jgi:hypothetical protein
MSHLGAGDVLREVARLGNLRCIFAAETRGSPISICDLDTWLSPEQFQFPRFNGILERPFCTETIVKPAKTTALKPEHFSTI